MWRRPVRLIPTALIPIFKHVNENDYNTLDRTVRDEPKTGWERVKKMYSKKYVFTCLLFTYINITLLLNLMSPLPVSGSRKRL